MRAQLSTLALVVAAGALLTAGYALHRTAPAHGAGHVRIGRLEARLARFLASHADTDDVSGDARRPRLQGRLPRDPASSAPATAGVRAEAPALQAAAPGEAPAVLARIEDLVSASVEAKAAQIEAMRDKRPTFARFAETLGLTDRQRWGIEQEVLRGQRDMHTLLTTPTADGTLLFDDLVEVLARSAVEPDQERAQWARFLGRLLTERVPGTSDTYAARAEAVKDGVRRSLERDLSAAQRATYEAWQLDPTEIQGIEDSPWAGLADRVRERMQALETEASDRR